MLPCGTRQSEEERVEDDLLVHGLLLIAGGAVDQGDPGILESCTVLWVQRGLARVSVQTDLLQVPEGASACEQGLEPTLQTASRLCKLLPERHVLIVPVEGCLVCA